MFETNYKVIEIRESGARITHCLRGKKKEVMKDVEAFKGISKDYEIVDKKTLIVWT